MLQMIKKTNSVKYITSAESQAVIFNAVSLDTCLNKSN